MWFFKKKAKKKEDPGLGEKRQFTRVDTAFTVKLKLIDWESKETQFMRTVTCLDMNEKGIRIRDTEDYQVGARCDLWIQASGKESLEIHGEVMRSEEVPEEKEKRDVVIAFKGLSEPQISSVCRLISLLSTLQDREL